MAEATSYSGYSGGYKPGKLLRLVEQDRKDDVAKYLAANASYIKYMSLLMLPYFDWNILELDKCVMITIINKKPDILRCLVEAGVNLDVSHVNESTGAREPLLHIAVKTGDPDILNIFVEYFKGQPKAQICTDLLIAAFESRNVDFVTGAWKMLQEMNIDSIKGDSWFPIHDLISSYSALNYASDIRTYMIEEILDFLIDKGYKVNEELPHDSYTLRLYSVRRNETGYTPLRLAVERGDLDYVRALIKHGATVLAQRDFPENMWQIAYDGTYVNDDVLPELLQGFIVAEHQEKSASLLHRVCRSNKGNVSAVRYLLDRGVEINFTDRMERRTPLMAAIENGADHIVMVLVQHSLEYARCYIEAEMIEALLFLLSYPLIKDNDKLELIIKGYSRARIYLNALNKEGHTLLMVMDWERLISLGKLLMQCGADVNAVAEDGRTVLWNFVGRDARFDYIVEGFMCFFNGWDSTDKTPERLIHNARLCSVRLLLAQNIDIGLSRHQHQHKTPLQFAFHLREPDICNLLLDADCSLYKMAEFLSGIPESELSEDMQRVRARILEMCDEPYSLKAQARLAALRAIGQCDLRETLHRMHRSRVLPKALLDYLGKTINFNADSL